MAGASIWGLFWIPLHYLEAQGLSALWSLVMIMAAALVPALFMAVRAKELSDLRSPDTWITGFALGLASTLYFVALAYTDVIRVIFLFYLLPLWTTLAARIIHSQPIRASRLLVMLIALCGLWLLLGGGTEVPIPESVGDWCAIVSGMCWGISLTLLQDRLTGGASSRALVTIGFALVLSLLAALIVNNGNKDFLSLFGTDMASAQTVSSRYLIIAVATGFGLLAFYPALFGQIWGAMRLPAPTAALLTMSEIIVAVGSAALLIGTDLSRVALLGGVIILCALCLDIALQFKGAPAP